MAEASALQGKLIEFKGASLAVMTASLRDTDAVRLADALHMMLGGMPDFFAGEPAILDFAQLASRPEPVDWTGHPQPAAPLPGAADRRAPPARAPHEGARRAGLAVLGSDDSPPSARSPAAPPHQAPAPAPDPRRPRPRRRPPPPPPDEQAPRPP
jgi:septum site-determining protein MinC